LRFDRHVPPGGYLWWYVDALSADGAYGLTLIAFVGSVFSPYYAWARRHGNPDPANHCALNVALYGPRAGRWSMTERAAAAVARACSSLSIGRSTLDWDGTALHISVDEICAPIPTRLRGTIRLTPSALRDSSFALDEGNRHQWTPFAPCSQIELHFSEPALKWSGMAYFDSNFGEEPLETAFRDWTWSRATRGERLTEFPTRSNRRRSSNCRRRNGASDAIPAPIAGPRRASSKRSKMRRSTAVRCSAPACSANRFR
jgi:carotenoid 1,2-hydratase